MRKFDAEIKRDLFEYLSIENKSDKDIAEAINYLEGYHFQSVNNWHDDNYYNDCNYGLLFGLCGFNGPRQQAMKEMLQDCFGVSVF